MTTLLILAGFFVVVSAVQVALTYATSRLVRTERATWRTAVCVTLVMLVWNFGGAVLLWSLGDRFDGVRGQLFLFVAGMTLVMLTYRATYRADAKQLAAFAALQLLLAAIVVATAVPLRAYAVAAFVQPTNPMAPTLLGHRREYPCRKCGGLVITTVDKTPRPPSARHFMLSGTCLACGEDSPLPEPLPEELPGDRFLLDKRAEPERWDVVAFRNPHDESVLYAMRIVGLPGEEIIIADDGSLSIDGRTAASPADAKLHYVLMPDDIAFDMLQWGDPRRPIKLGADEYFILGDNSYRANDGRFLGPIRRDVIVGTVSVIYWPPSRWRIFR